MKRKFICIILILCILSNFICALAEYGIKVDTKKCKITIYEKTSLGWVELGTKRCCVGANNKTPKGKFTIYKKEKYFIHDDKQYNFVSYFSDKCAFHSVPYYNNAYDNDSLGHHRSGGCIRLTKNVAKWIYKYCKIGTKIYIY